tara:strand:- start:2316 stop:2657 length:342 start_codon:yes stop_codon:yes gene_type:complete
MISYLFSLILLASPLSDVECPNWIGDGNTVAPPGVSLSAEQKRLNRLRCYWQVVKPAEWQCKRQSPAWQCKERTDNWLTANFQWGTLRQACQDLTEDRNATARTLMINVRENR